MLKEFIFNDPIAFCAVILSVASMALAVIFSQLQVVHNKKSILPVPSIQITNYKNNISVRIENVGTGPMIIKNINCVMRDKEQKEKHEKLLINFLPHEYTYVTCFFDEKIIPNFTIPVGSNMMLMKISAPNDTQRNNLREVLSKITIYIEYTDVYNSKFREYSRDLHLFAVDVPEMEMTL